MHCKQWIFDMDGTLTDSMVVVWEGAPEALLARFGRTPKADLHETLLTMGMEDGAQYLIREYALPLDRNGYLDVMREVIAQLYEKVELKPGVRDTLARLRAEGARMCVCSNTWSSQCRAVLTRLGIDEYFDFYIEARGAMSKSSAARFMEALHRLGGQGGGPQQGDDQYYGVAAEVVKALHSGGGQAAEAKEGGDLLTGGGEVGGIEEHETHRQQGEHIQVL